jgi:hypothetical protein
MERVRILKFDMIFPCKSVDFLVFFDYMISPKCVKHFNQENKNFVRNENILVLLKRLNLWPDINQREFMFPFLSGVGEGEMSHFDFESVLAKYLIF